ncbi:hypothetical protein HZS_278 [Henneguya salminicola]|nr:hypothetical protein HZS_278 [Henneguya salminicola]
MIIRELPPSNRDTLCTILEHIQYMSTKIWFGFDRREQLIKFYAPLILGYSSDFTEATYVQAMNSLVSIPNKLIRAALKLTRLQQEQNRRNISSLGSSVHHLRAYNIPNGKK